MDVVDDDERVRTAGPARPRAVPAPRPARTRSDGPVDRAAGGALVVAGLAYALFLAAGPLGARLDPARSYVSELAARDQPAGPVFRAADLLTGALVLLVGALLVGRRADRWGRRVGVALGVFGLATLLDAAAPLSCAPAGVPACAAAEHASDLAAGVGLHEITSVAANGAAIVATILLVSLRARTGPLPRAAERVWLAALPVQLASGLAVVLHETVGSGLDDVIGTVQRLQVLGVSSVLVALGVVVLAGRPTTPRA